jgi:hypothetical protein
MDKSDGKAESRGTSDIFHIIQPPGTKNGVEKDGWVNLEGQIEDT